MFFSEIITNEENIYALLGFLKERKKRNSYHLCGRESTRYEKRIEMEENRRLCIFAFSAISHGYIQDLWPDFDSISRCGLFTYWHPEYVRRLMLCPGLYCFDAIIQIYLLCY